MWGNVVVAPKDSPASYHLAVVLDDALQGATDVVRGQDLFWSTGIHRLLQALLGLPDPVYHHHKLILDEAGQKLSKSTNATGLRELRAAGQEPFDIRRMVGLGRGRKMKIVPGCSCGRAGFAWHVGPGARGPLWRNRSPNKNAKSGAGGPAGAKA